MSDQVYIIFTIVTQNCCSILRSEVLQVLF